MKPKQLINIALKLKKYSGSSSRALMMTLELALLKKYRPQITKELEEHINNPSKLITIYNRFYHELSLRHRITSYEEGFPLTLITKYFISAGVAPADIASLIQEFTIERNNNDLYGFSTPIELKELMVGLLDIKNDESVYNPCFGIGGLFGTIASVSQQVTLYGEEIEEAYRVIGGLTAQLSGIKSCTLKNSDVLSNPAYCTKDECDKFDKVICNPPFDLSFENTILKEDFRFKKYGIPPANASELVFLEHAAASMITKAVVLVRLSVLKRSSNEAKIRTAMAFDGIIETIIALPKGIIPHWKEGMALIVLSHHNKEILFIDADKPYFSKRRGRRNTIYRADEIIETVKDRKVSQYAISIPIVSISAESLSPMHYLQKNCVSTNVKALSNITESIFRAQRLGTLLANRESGYREVGIRDIVPNGYTTTSDSVKSGRRERIEQFRLNKYDILLPLRGYAGNVGIIGKSDDTLVPNSGLIIIRLKAYEDTHGLYLYLRSTIGQDALNKLYEESPNRTINPDILGTLLIPNRFGYDTEERFQKLIDIQKKIDRLSLTIREVVNH